LIHKYGYQYYYQYQLPLQLSHNLSEKGDGRSKTNELEEGNKNKKTK
jgi:hypothetical protein